MTGVGQQNSGIVDKHAMRLNGCFLNITAVRYLERDNLVWDWLFKGRVADREAGLTYKTLFQHTIRFPMLNLSRGEVMRTTTILPSSAKQKHFIGIEGYRDVWRDTGDGYKKGTWRGCMMEYLYPTWGDIAKQRLVCIFHYAYSMLPPYIYLQCSTKR